MFGPGWNSVRTQRRPEPGKEAYKPKFARGKRPAAAVPDRLKNVRLHRKKRNPSMGKTPLIVQVVIVAAIVGFVLVAWSVLSSTGAMPWAY